MKRFVSILLAVMILISGCSFIGKKQSDSDKIIPDSVQTDNAGNSAESAFNINNTAQSGSSGASAAATASSTGSDKLLTDSSGVSGGPEAIGMLIDNGAGKGVVNDPKDKDSILITLYYRNKEGLLVPVTRKVSKQEGVAKAAINGLVDQAVTREQLAYYGLYPVLPQGTKIKGISIKNGNAAIDFSKEFLNAENKQNEQMMVSSVVYTLTGFKTISNVEIRVDGKTLDRLVNGTDLSKSRNRQNTFINSEETELKEGFIKCDLYYMAYGTKDINYMMPVSTQIENSEDSQLLAAMFSELSKKPSAAEYFTSFPEGTKLLSFDESSNLATLNFSSQISNYGGSEKENSLLNQIYYTISQLKNIKKVKILIDGKEAALPEGSEVASAKALPDTWNKIIDK
ncbi:germination protein M [Ruminiclostridium sufflavum DSM 19573]|uniref:Germination protein M n=1 Tax=Ruminiclostridium sufflavum DSM 19573 TaxID=1121337 RepID=A0A318Y968_9FIRM|nr:GerMN domain-containing protein [Ruminiclostridium sufflavum]PYG88848.1 germination protein M [Ruminiclostridium sufflavum DSM 19573]